MSALRRPHAPAPVLVINDHHYPAIHAHSLDEDSSSSMSKKIRRHSRPQTPPPSRRALQAARSPGLPVPSPLREGPLPSPLVPLFSAAPSTASSSSSSSSSTSSPSSAQ